MIRTRLTAAAALSVLALGLTACGDDAESSTGSGSTAPETSMEQPMGTPMATPSEDGTETPMEGAMAGGLVGPGCADYAAQVPTGAGSVEGMAQDPVATAASNNPLLTTLVSAVSGQLNPDVDLVDTLNGGEFTVFAPVDDAFAQVPPATLEALKTDSAALTEVLTYHVVPGRLSPEQVVGAQTTVQGQQVEVTGSGDMLKVGDADVVCGGVQTANATVYLIDGVLTPPAG
ncbi:fasciclin domain-containing protein [Vallicoccus soli]|uniref:Fasciclin domain-containing protein n=1 Tax=Vallicoccus soli TaxID=2339232 RepID=A0A3A3Z1V6_9ACTN|nr:fasciclin domain-containing protein [Vallicoccus soli]RJK97153.1 fasciclin domain-containing protein [Vallicoccus soli]